jgi:hypothetical protein
MIEIEVETTKWMENIIHEKVCGIYYLPERDF